MSGVLADIDAELATFQKLIDDSKRRIHALRKARDLIFQSMGGSATLAPSEAAASKPKEFQTGQLRSGSQVEMVVRTARTVLLREGRPMTRSEILEAFQTEGFEVKAANPAKRVGKILWSSDNFQHVGTGYWLVGVPLPSAR